MNSYKFRVYELDMLDYGDIGWVENNRFDIGAITISAPSFKEITPKMFLNSVSRVRIESMFGFAKDALPGSDLRRYYVEDLYGDGSWFEIGMRRGHQPLYGLRTEGVV